MYSMYRDTYIYILEAISYVEWGLSPHAMCTVLCFHAVWQDLGSLLGLFYP